MYLTRWDPFETLTGLQDEIDRVFNKKLHLTKSDNKQTTLWYPSVDIYEDTEAFNFDVEVPGIDKDLFDIKVEDNILTIKGERKKNVEKKEANYYRIEREFGLFARSFSLPDTANSEQVNAEYTNGVLHVKIAKKEAAKPKKIAVRVK